MQPFPTAQRQHFRSRDVCRSLGRSNTRQKWVDPTQGVDVHVASARPPKRCTPDRGGGALNRRTALTAGGLIAATLGTGGLMSLALPSNVRTPAKPAEIRSLTPTTSRDVAAMVETEAALPPTSVTTPAVPPTTTQAPAPPAPPAKKKKNEPPTKKKHRPKDNGDKHRPGPRPHDR